MKLVDIFDYKKVMESSELVNGLQVKAPGARELSAREIKILEEAGNTSTDWSKVKITGELLPDRIKNSVFIGEVTIGSLDGEVNIEGAPFPCGIYDSVISHSVLLGESLLCRVRLLHNYMVKKGAVLFDTGIVSFTPKSSLGNGLELSLAIETGGREVKTFAEITVDIAEQLATRRKDAELLREYEEFIQGYLNLVAKEKGVLGEYSRIISTPTVKNIFLGPFALIKGAAKVEDSTILSNREEKVEIKEGAIVEHSIIQWGSEVTSMSIVSESVLTEHSHVERHGKVTQSLLGPNTGVAEGEVTASLVGPFVGFHHQSLLIAALWPEGKGNVGYGANVGSNHTSKAPDQEIWCGEGTFFGLGTNIKFPANFTKAPYSIIATGVTTLPQKVEFPFSLINSPAVSLPGVSPAFNEIIPGWVLSDNLFTIRRNEGKYRKRNKAKRSEFNFEVLRPDIVDLMIEARKRLKNIAQVKDFYLGKDLPGLGKNYLFEKNRKKAVDIYTFFIRYYALCGLKKKLEESREWENILGEESPDTRWEHERKIIREEFPGKSLKELLQVLAEMQEKIAEMVEESKRKDDIRGKKVIEDYDSAHTCAEDDSFVKETWQETRKILQEIEGLLARC